MKKTAGELAKIVGGTLYGDPAVVIDDVRSAESAGSSHVTLQEVCMLSISKRCRLVLFWWMPSLQNTRRI